MKAALLCNGPSKIAYDPATPYDYRIGCNVPWSEVDSTVIVDYSIIFEWNKKRDLIKVPAYISQRAFSEVAHCRSTPNEIPHRDFFKNQLIEIVHPLPEHDSSGHVACLVLMKKGFTEIDIYGCDSWFEQTTVSSTWDIIITARNPNDMKKVKGWRDRWHTLMKKYPEIKVNFIDKNGISHVGQAENTL